MESSRTLVSFDICPFVQKARIVFDLKGLDVPTSHIDLSEKPRWFLDRVPTGKVPVLLDGDKAIFESNVILEYADEVTSGALLPADPLARAEERAWMVYVDDLIMIQYRVLSSTEANEVERHLDALFRGLARLESVVGARGPDMGLLECGAAPVFSRIEAVPFLRARFTRSFPEGSAITLWSRRILASDAVRRSLPERFVQRLAEYFGRRGSFVLGHADVTA